MQFFHDYLARDLLKPVDVSHALTAYLALADRLLRKKDAKKEKAATGWERYKVQAPCPGRVVDPAILNARVSRSPREMRPVAALKVLDNDADTPAASAHQFMGYHPQGAGFARLSPKGPVEVPNPADKGNTVSLLGSATKMGQPMWSPDAKLFGLAMISFGALNLWDTATGKLIFTSNGTPVDRNKVSFSLVQLAHHFPDETTIVQGESRFGIEPHRFVHVAQRLIRVTRFKPRGEALRTPRVTHRQECLCHLFLTGHPVQAAG
jgi:hypothetical protein